MPSDPSGGDDPNESVEDVPTVTCSRCDETWELTHELEDLQAGNRAIEQFALDHQRHVGHFPDEISPWTADCRRCPGGDRFLAERPARRWAETHARHARHAVELDHGSLETGETVDPPDW